MLWTTSVLTTLLALVAASPLELRAVKPTATLANGNVVIGTATGVLNQPAVTGLVSAYLAIPYAASPTRFAAPTTTSFATKTVTTLGPACYQVFANSTAGKKGREYFENPFGQSPLPESEDCLHVNVFVPPNTNKNSKKTVMVWLYGGNLATGSNAVKFYNGSSLAVNNDVIVVVPNYRTNLFGFSGAPNLPHSPNVGFLDQRYALGWVQTNIASFGGDPGKVTIFGQSAGAYSVKQLLAQPPSPRPFQAAIMESSGFAQGKPSDAWSDAVGHLCKNRPAGQSDLQCMRNLPPSTIQYYQANPPANTAQFGAVEDYTYVGSNTIDQLKAGTFADVPLLIGTNHDETTIFLNILDLPNDTDLVTGVQQITGTNLGNTANKTSDLFPNLSGFQLISRVATDVSATCTTSLFSRAVAQYNSASVWRYRYDLDGQSTRYFQGAGAYHTSEIPEVFGTYPLKTQYGTASDAQKQLSVYMQKAWATFAKSPSTGPDPGSWSEFKSTGSQIGVLGGTNNTNGLDLQTALWTDYPCVVYGPLIISLGNAY